MQIVPSDFILQVQKGRFVDFKIRQNPTPLGTDPPSALAMHPPEFQPDLRLCLLLLKEI